jgi:thiol-disulfide isomerase/thioredoxin
MKKLILVSQGGFGVFAVIGIFVLILAAGGAVYLGISQSDDDPGSSEMMMEEDKMMQEDDNMMMEEGDAMMEEEAMMKDEESTMMEGDAMMKEEGTMMVGEEMSFSGTVLAGDSSPLLDFNRADYEKAIESDKLVVLYFYANWCPICRAEFPRMQSAFDSLESKDVVGFRVNYNDSETDDFEKQLASQFGVAYQHTKVFLKNGERVLKSPESWNQSRYTTEINKYLN